MTTIIDGRFGLRRVCRTLVAAALLVGAGGTAFGASAQVLQPAELAERPAISDAVLSTSGRYVAFVARRDENYSLMIRDLETGTTTPILSSQAREAFGGVYVDWIIWKSDDRLVVGFSNISVGRIGNRADGDVFSVNQASSILSVARDGSAPVRIAGPHADPNQPGGLLAQLVDDPEHILLTYTDRTNGLNVARVNVLTGESQEILSGDRRVADYIVDRRGEVVARTALRGSLLKTVVMETRDADGGWTEVLRLREDDIRNLPDYSFLGSTDKPNEAYVAVSSDAEGGEETAGVHIYDFAARTLGPTIWRHPRYDASAIVVDSRTSAFLGGCYTADVFRCDFVDRERGADMEAIRGALGPTYSVSISSRSRDGNRWLVFATAPNDPGRYLLYDAERQSLEQFTSLYRLSGERLAPMRRIDYQAADGTALSGYLTRPPGLSADAKPPLVVMPHGGPEIRDALNYDPWVQLLVSRGYQVFQPNFRGSGGFGGAFARAGYREWGGRMQTDVSDGVRNLIATGAADAERVCIVGASYGGYAALQAGATEPDLYRCVISIAGVSDLNAMMRWERSERGADSDVYEYWLKSIGDPRTDEARLTAASPIQHAADWRPPVLLIHGEVDRTVPVEQSRTMQRALDRAGHPVRYVELPNQGHNGWTTATETTVMTEMEDFLAANLPVQP